MNIRQSALALLLATAIAAPLRAQSYDEAGSANAAALMQAALLDHADNGLRRWLAANAEAVSLEKSQVDEIDGLLNGWRIYTALECDLVGTTTGGNVASKATFTSICQEGRYVARIQSVDETKKGLMRVLGKAERESLYASTCLEQLTPLKTNADFIP